MGVGKGGVVVGRGEVGKVAIVAVQVGEVEEEWREGRGRVVPLHV